ncbi:MAG TPA: DinB family protein, partial [Thermoanaerobaculia bacterium]|nr:DinB family protein [Thermoanaerobaculia bacterium]
MNGLQYPVGRHDPSAPVSAEQIRQAIEDIRELPGRLAEAVGGLDDTRLDSPYRPQGWTVRQVVHHVVDSHVNAYVRLRLALTEDRPDIRGYQQELWAEL